MGEIYFSGGWDEGQRKFIFCTACKGGVSIFGAMSDKKLIFLTGVGRSGTTVLQSMLNSHSQIHFPPETHFFKRHILPFLLHGKKTSGKALADDSYLKRLDQDKLQALLQGEIADIEDCRRMMFTVVGDAKSTFSGDKDTEYVRYLPHLKFLFPSAFLLHIKRDPRDVVLSRKKAPWGSKGSLAFHAAEYQYYIQKVMKEGPNLFGERYHELRYEDLLENPEKELSSILSKMQLEFEPGMLEFHKRSSNLVAGDEAAWKQNLNKPLMKGNSGKWRHSLSEEQAGLVQSGIEDFMRHNAYPLVEARPHWINLLKKHLIKGLFRGKTYKERLR